MEDTLSNLLRLLLLFSTAFSLRLLLLLLPLPILVSSTSWSSFFLSTSFLSSIVLDHLPPSLSGRVIPLKSIPPHSAFYLHTLIVRTQIYCVSLVARYPPPLFSSLLSSPSAPPEMVRDGESPFRSETECRARPICPPSPCVVVEFP